MIAFNMQPLASGNLTGIGYYAANVMKELIPVLDEDYELHVFDYIGRNGAAPMLQKHLGGSFDENKLHTVTSMPLSLYIRTGNLGRIFPYEKLTKSSADLTVFYNFLCPLGVTGDNVITIYDMVCERYPGTMDGRNRRLLRRYLRPSAENASAIITISEFSKREICELLNVPQEKVRVAYCGVDTDIYCPFASEKEEISGRAYLERTYGIGRYILYVGTLEPRKNIVTIVKAFDKIASKHPDVKLVLAGGIGWKSEETLKTIAGSPFTERIVKTGYISDDDKKLLYRAAEFFVFPSLYEGFGMPVTEAMACGTPAVIADTSSLPEASGGIAPKAAPDDVSGFADLFDGILSGRTALPSRDELIRSASQFKWSNAARVYNDTFGVL